MAVGASASRSRALPLARQGGAAPTYLLRLPVQEIIRLVRAATEASEGAPEFYVEAYRHYTVEEDYDRSTYVLRDKNQFDLVMAEAVLQIEPRLEQNYWVLSVIVHEELGPQNAEDETAFLGRPLTLDAFEADVLAHPEAAVSVRLETDTPSAKAHFDQWWADLKARHPRAANVAGTEGARTHAKP